ncbi:hypothetical protein J5X84_12555 [Streptosporangiaceae bacterium NEAU-GS5]|nr:hypothetical protein [Streptosporangiaceae bacterium NEAU-GS5]
MPAGIWPRSTPRGAVSLYNGTISTRRTRVDLEVGDTAGEYWLDFNNDDARDPGYLEYVVSAHGIAHVIPMKDLLDRGERMLANEIDDLRLAARLKNHTRGSASFVPLIVVLSKADLVVPLAALKEPDAGLLRVMSGQELPSARLLRSLDQAYSAERLVDLLRVFTENLQRDFSTISFVFSSAPAIVEARLRAGEQHGEDLVRWFLREAPRLGRVRRDE